MEPIIVTTPEDVAALAALIVYSDTPDRIVCLTSRPGEVEPALDPKRVRDIVGDDTPIYVIAHGPLTRELKGLLPPKYDVFGGAGRIYWPSLQPEDTPLTHPLIFDRSGEYDDAAFTSLERFFRPGPPIGRGAITGPDPLREALEQNRQLKQRVRDLQGELSRRQRVAHALRGRPQPPPAP